MNDTSGQGRKSAAVDPNAKLFRMLQSMSRRFPNTSLLTTAEGFGVRLRDGRYLHVVSSGLWSDEDTRDFLVLFATWLVADPDRLRNGVPLQHGVSVRGLVE